MSLPQSLEYEQPRLHRVHSAWSLVGFALSLAIALLPTWLWWELGRLWHNRRLGAGIYAYSISPLYYAIATIVAAVCVVGILRGKKFFGVAGLVIVFVSVISIAILVKGSPW